MRCLQVSIVNPVGNFFEFVFELLKLSWADIVFISCFKFLLGGIDVCLQFVLQLVCFFDGFILFQHSLFATS